MSGDRPLRYRPPFPFTSGHVQTVFPTLFRRLPPPAYRRERIDTPDGDFLDLDWSRCDRSSGRLVILCHGLEGSARSVYVRGMAHAFNRHGWDALAWNYRGCSGEVNRRPRSYHAGATDDLETVVHHARASGYRTIVPIGFSLGGNLVLKYLGERGADADPALRTAIAFSAPADLEACSDWLTRPANVVYQYRFMRQLREKMRQFADRFPDAVDLDGLDAMRTFRDFDDRFTARLHGFADAVAYWSHCSSRRFIADIRVPTLIVNARNDPFLPDACYPRTEADANPAVTLEMPRHGGHVGFVRLASDRLYWSEVRALAFCRTHAQPEPPNETRGHVRDGYIL